MRVAEFHFDLPEELIAQSPPPVRGSSRMLVLDRHAGEYRDNFFRNLPQLLQPGDLLILNDSRVIPARLYATRARSPHTQASSPDPSGRIEVLLTQQLNAHEWTALVRPGRKVQPGERLHFAASGNHTPLLEAEVIAAADYGERTLRFSPTEDFRAILEQIGHMPLPPYIHRDDTAEVLLDLHSFQSAGEAFAMIGPRDNTGTLEPFARAFEEGQLALHLRTPRVVEGWLDIYAAGVAQRAGGKPVDPAEVAFGKGTNEYMRSRGGYGVTLECGQHEDPAAPGVAYEAILSALRLLGMIAPSPDALPPPKPSLLRLVSVVDRFHEEDQFVREWATFDPVSRGEPIAVREDGSVLQAERDGFIVFPNAEALPGTEWFYFAVNSDRDLGHLR